MALDDLMRRRGLTRGLAGYWNAKYFTALSNVGLELRQIHANGDPRFWDNNAFGYFERNASDRESAWPSYEFILTDGLNENDITRVFGEPEAKEKAGRHWVWSLLRAWPGSRPVRVGTRHPRQAADVARIGLTGGVKSLLRRKRLLANSETRLLRGFLQALLHQQRKSLISHKSHIDYTGWTSREKGTPQKGFIVIHPQCEKFAHGLVELMSPGADKPVTAGASAASVAVSSTIGP